MLTILGTVIGCLTAWLIIGGIIGSFVGWCMWGLAKKAPKDIDI